jgi:hypothetical protein
MVLVNFGDHDENLLASDPLRLSMLNLSNY